MCNHIFICVDKIPFFRKFDFSHITYRSSLYFWHTTFSPPNSYVIGLQLTFPIDKGNCSNQPISLYFKYRNHRVLSIQVICIKCFDCFMILHSSIFFNTYQTVSAQLLHHSFPLLVGKFANAGRITWCICNYNILIDFSDRFCC